MAEQDESAKISEEVGQQLEKDLEKEDPRPSKTETDSTDEAAKSSIAQADMLASIEDHKAELRDMVAAGAAAVPEPVAESYASMKKRF